MSRDEALLKAKSEELDLIEIAPTANPPVAKIWSYDKYRYQKEKEERRERLAQKAEGLKQVRISAKAAKHDLMVKVKKVNDFLAKGAKVEIMMILRGREKGNKDWARGKLDEFINLLGTDHKIIMQPKYTGRGFVAQISK